MEIKDAINMAKAYLNDCPIFCDECDNEYCEVPEIKRLLDETYNELKWYRGQDLIKREDVWNCRPEWLNENMEDAIKSAHNKGWNECNLEWCDTVKQIPKVEPLKMRDANIEEIKNTNDYIKTISKPTGIHFEADIIGDCKNCKHYETGDGFCRSCGETINHHEVDVPKAEPSKEE